MQTHRVASVRLALAALTLAAPLAAPAQDFIKPGDETFTLNLGGIVNRFDTSVKLNGPTRTGSDINLEGTGLSDSMSSVEAMGTWRFLPKHRIDAIYYGGKRTGSKTIDRDITVGDVTFPINTTVSAENKTQFFLADYRYSFMKSDQMEIAGLLGVYGGHYEFKFTSSVPSRESSASTTVPLPVIGVSADWHVSPRWTVTALDAGISAKIGDYDGSSFIGGLSTEYMLMRNFGVGVAYLYHDLNVDVTKGSFNGNINAKASNISAYAQLKF